MALLTFLTERSEIQKHPPPKRKKSDHQRQMQTQTQKQRDKQKRQKQTQTLKQKQKQKPQKQTQTQAQREEKKSRKPPTSWDQFKNLLTCKQIEGSRVHDPSKKTQSGPYAHPSKLSSSCSSICSFSDVAHGNTRVVHRADNSPDGHSVGHETPVLTRKPCQNGSASSRSLIGSTRSNGGGSYASSSSYSRAMQFRRLSGCYECRMIVDPSRYPITPKISACSQCGEVFPKLENLEIHQAVRHAVSELGPEDSGRNIVEIIFKSSWLKKDSPICEIERILKVHSTQHTIQRFEDCRETIKARELHGSRKDARCAADGNELLRFHCTTLTCSLGACGSSSLCGSFPGCGVCTIIRHGFQGKHGGATAAGHAGEAKVVWTTASSGRAHDSVPCMDVRRAMLVCRVIAGRVKRLAKDPPEAVEEGGGRYDSVAGYTGVYSNLEELAVFNPRAILPCFVVVYKVLES